MSSSKGADDARRRPAATPQRKIYDTGFGLSSNNAVTVTREPSRRMSWLPSREEVQASGSELGRRRRRRRRRRSSDDADGGQGYEGSRRRDVYGERVAAGPAGGRRSGDSISSGKEQGDGTRIDDRRRRPSRDHQQGGWPGRPEAGNTDRWYEYIAAEDDRQRRGGEDDTRRSSDVGVTMDGRGTSIGARRASTEGKRVRFDLT